MVKSLEVIEEKLSNFIERMDIFATQNSKEHVEILAQIASLATHVNEQLQQHASRLDKMEKYTIWERGKYKGLSIGLGVVLSLLALIVYLKSIGLI